MTTPSRTRTNSRAGQRSRFARQSAPVRHGRARAGRAVPRRPLGFGRQPPKKSAVGGTIDRITGALRRSGPKATSRSGGAPVRRTAGLALFAGATALALRNRDKLKALVGDRGQPSATQPTAEMHPPTVAPGDPEPTTTS